MKFRCICLTLFIVIKYIYNLRGTQGIVYHAVERSTGNSYAAKCMYGKGTDAKNWMHHELDIMNQLHDRHLIRARDAFENKNSLTLVTDLYPYVILFIAI